MHAAIVTALGGPRFGEFQEPAASAGQVVARVAAAALNPIDVLRASGALPGTPDPPFVAGGEGVGLLEDGRRVYFQSTLAPYGSLAQRALVSADLLFDVEDSVPDQVAASLGIAGMTPWLALELCAGLEPGEHVLVLGATGTVGLVAVQAARLLGAGRVIAAGRDARRLDRVRQHGADATVSLRDHESLAQAFSEAAGGRIDVIVDAVGGTPALAAIAAATDGGRLVQIGHSAGDRVALSLSSLRARRLAILGHAVSTVPLALRREAYRKLCAHAATGELWLDIETVALRDVADAWTRQKSGAGVKLVIVP